MSPQQNYAVHYLLDEGYANNKLSALKILEAMSDEWLDQILEKFNSSDYEEYHQKDHSYGQPEYDRWDLEYKNWAREQNLRDIQRNTGRRKKDAAARRAQRQSRARRP